MISAPSSDIPQTDKPRLPSELFRTVASLLIFVHLFGLAICLATGTDSGAASLLQMIKIRTPYLENYLVQLWLDHGYDYHLMNEQPQGLDWDHRVIAKINYADGKTEKLTIPAADMWPGDRRERHQRLAWYVGWYVDRATADNATTLDADRKLRVPASIGAGLIRQRQTEGATSVDIGCDFHNGILREALRSQNPSESDPMDPRYFISVAASKDPNPSPLNVHVWLDADGRPLTFESLPKGETSPVRKTSGGKSPKATTSAGRSADDKAEKQ